MLGGEPTTRKDFLDICSFFDENNIKFGFNTNSILFNERFIKGLINNKSLGNIVFSIEAPNSLINDKIRGKRVFDRIVQAINLTVEEKRKNNLDFSIIVNMVLSKENYKYLSEMIDFCVNLGVDRIDLLQFLEDGNAKNSNLSLGLVEIVECMKVISSSMKKYGDEFTIAPKFVRPLAKDVMKIVYGLEFPDISHSCGAGLNFFFLDNKGAFSLAIDFREYMIWIMKSFY